jgi:Zinc dependent phospholipase C
MTPSRGWWMLGAFGVGLVLLWPGHAYAWGPLAHIDFARTALEDLGGVSQVIRILLQKCGNQYLYGALAADIIVGKNLAPYAVHAHNWRVGFKVLDQSKGDAERAFAYGYLAHLAVDTIAHNYYVPYKVVTSFGRRRTGHAYWEMRYDQQLDADLWQVARRVTRRGLRRHDLFLKEALVGAYVLPFALSRRFYETLLVSARLKKWQRMSQLVAAERNLPLLPAEVIEMKTLAVEQVRDLLRHGENARCTQADPTGLRNLKLSHDLRRRLERLKAEGQPVPPDALEGLQAAFRAAIHGPLKLPQVEGLYPTGKAS